MTFVFSGTFISNIDDTFTRIYDPNVFRNGDTTRIIVMRADGEDMTEKDYSTMLSVKYVEIGGSYAPLSKGKAGF